MSLFNYENEGFESSEIPSDFDMEEAEQAEFEDLYHCKLSYSVTKAAADRYGISLSEAVTIRTRLDDASLGKLFAELDTMPHGPAVHAKITCYLKIARDGPKKYV
jgi:hypothetical protein